MDMLQSRIFFPQNYDVVAADYDVSQSCRFSHATAQIMNYNSLQMDLCVLYCLQYTE